MDYNGLMDIIKKRRSTRAYKSDPIPDDFVRQVIEAARWAPTGANTQPFEFVVVSDQKIKTKIKEILSENAVAAVTKQGAVPVVKRPYLEAAPILIIVLGDPRFEEAFAKGVQREEIFQASLSAAVQNMHLAATALGLGGSVWTTVSPWAGMKVKELLNIPQVFAVKTIMPLGYPKTTPSTPVKRDPVVHVGSYDMRVFKEEDAVQEIIEKTASLKGKLSYRRSF